MGRLSACLKERIVAMEQMIMIRIDIKNTECKILSFLLMLGTRQLLICKERNEDKSCSKLVVDLKIANI